MTRAILDRGAQSGRRWTARSLALASAAALLLAEGITPPMTPFGPGGIALADAPTAAPAPSPKPAKALFGRRPQPSAQAPAAIGGYARGCLAGGTALAEDGPGWQAMRLSRNRRYGHPDLIAYVQRLSAAAQGLGWPGLLIGDLAQPRGGPMLTGHRSHQIGLDADIWLKPAPSRRLSARERESVSAINYVDRRRKRVIAGFSDGHHALLQAAAEDAAVARIFVNPVIKKALCDRVSATGAEGAWLRKIRPWWGHDHHFHVRLHCPAGSTDCRPQNPPPEGTGCGAELQGWLNPPKPDPTQPVVPRKPRLPLTLADLPNSCSEVLSAPVGAAGTRR
ncbi:MAG: penicillin-insensitive murein endopeptidase [Pseudomonadota bacterium]